MERRGRAVLTSAFQGLPCYTAVTRLAVIEARAYGHLGNPEAAARAIRASLEVDRGRRDELHDDIGGEFGFP